MTSVDLVVVVLAVDLVDLAPLDLDLVTVRFDTMDPADIYLVNVDYIDLTSMDFANVDLATVVLVGLVDVGLTRTPQSRSSHRSYYRRESQPYIFGRC